MKLRIFTEPQFGATYDDQLRVAKAAEDLGFDAFFRSDHYLTMGAEGLPGPTDSWVTLAAIARETERIRLGTMVTSATFRYPGPLAISVAQVDQMSSGRVELGLGAGWFEAEHQAYGIPFPPLGARFDRLEDTLAIVSGLWTTPVDERFSYSGKVFTVTNSPGLPKPVQAPRPPIIVGGAGRKRTPALAARYADEFNAPFSAPKSSAALFERVRQACNDIERDPATLTLSNSLVLCCGRDDAEVARRAANIGISVDDARGNGLVGTPAELVDRIGSYAAIGSTRCYLQTLDMSDIDHLELVASEVARQLVG